MQKLEGEFAEYYNIRKRRSGASWQGRYWSTMIDNCEYLWDCMKYIDLTYKEQLNHECTPVCVRTRTGRRIDTNK